MSADSNGGQRKRRTWSRFSERKKPTEYEFVSHDLHWHYKPGQPPWEMGPEHVWNRWYIDYRNNSPFACSDWNKFRDPDAHIYRSYVAMQDEAETYVDGIIDDYESRDAYATLPQEWVAALQEGYSPFRYVGHCLLMTGNYIMSMAPSSYISNASGFQAADELRRVQRVAYQARQLQLHYPNHRFGDDRNTWENNSDWQPLRKVLEELIATKDWGQSFVELNYVVKPAVDEVFNLVLADAADANGDGLTAMMHRNLHQDSLRSRRWSAALVKTAVADQPENANLVHSWIAQLAPAVIDAVADVGTLLSTSACDTTPGATRQRIEAALAECTEMAEI